MESHRQRGCSMFESMEANYKQVGYETNANKKTTKKNNK